MENSSLDAVDCLFAFGYTIVKSLAPPPIFTKDETVFELSNIGADMRYKRSIALLLQEIDENKKYYTKRIVEIGKELL